MDEIIRSLHGQKHYSIIDLEDGYFQVPLKKGERDKKTFVTPDNRLL